jgi:hypothetical protein
MGEERLAKPCTDCCALFCQLCIDPKTRANEGLIFFLGMMKMQATDQKYYAKSLELACLALGKTSPNPVVGAVIDKDQQIVGEGYHHRPAPRMRKLHAQAAGQVQWRRGDHLCEPGALLSSWSYPAVCRRAHQGRY